MSDDFKKKNLCFFFLFGGGGCKFVAFVHLYRRDILTLVLQLEGSKRWSPEV